MIPARVAEIRAFAARFDPPARPLPERGAEFDAALAAAAQPSATQQVTAEGTQFHIAPVSAPPPVGGRRLAVPYAGLFEAAGARHGVDPALLAAVAKAESSFDPAAVSRSGAEGLMQLMPGTAAALGVTDSFDPAQAVDGAARLLKDHLARFGTVELALAAYNAGPGAVTRHGGVPPYRETQEYVKKIVETLEGGTLWN